MFSSSLPTAALLRVFGVKVGAIIQHATLESLNPQISGDPAGFALEAVYIPSNDSNIVSRDVLLGNLGVIAETDSNWYIPIKTGTPPQIIYVQLDTGAPDFSLMSTLIPLSVRGNAPVYDPGKSTSAKKIDGMKWSQSYAGGAYTYSGVVYTDSIKIGSLTFSNYAFEVCETSKTNIVGPPYGTFGLNIDPNGMPTKPDKIKSWFPAVMGYLHSPLFAVDFHISTKKGTFDFGFIDEKKYNGSIAYTSVVANNGGQWIVTMSGFAVGTTFIKPSFNVMVDTGGDGVYGFPRWAIDRYFAQIPYATWNSIQNEYQIPCDKIPSSFPDIVFGVGDSSKFTLQGRNIPYFYRDKTTNICATYVRVGGDDRVLWAKNVIQQSYVVFDYGNKRMGFADKASF